MKRQGKKEKTAKTSRMDPKDGDGDGDEDEDEDEEEEEEETGHDDDNDGDDYNDDDQVDGRYGLQQSPTLPPKSQAGPTIFQRLLDVVKLDSSMSSSSSSCDQNKTVLLGHDSKSKGDDDGGDDDDDESDHQSEDRKFRQNDTTTIRGKASVLVLISNDGYVLLTKRSPKLRSHPGQVALPGGKQDPEDNGDSIRTALRETYEEVGLDFRHTHTYRNGNRTGNDNYLSQQNQNQNQDQQHQQHQQQHHPMELHIIGHLSPSVRSINNLMVTCVVACTPFATKSQLDLVIQINEDEVSDWFWTPLSYFFRPSSSSSSSSGLRQSYDIWWHDRIFTYRHYDFEYLRVRDDDKTTTSSGKSTTKTFAITGLTAHLLYELSCLVYSYDDDNTTNTTTKKKSGDHEGDKGHRRRELHGQLTRYYDFPNIKTKTKTKNLDEDQSKSRSLLYSKKQDHYYVLVPPPPSPPPPPRSSHCAATTTAVPTKQPTALHQYDSYQQFLSKGQSARKKQRLLIHPNDYTLQQIGHNNNNNHNINDDEDEQYLFQICTADDRICWTFGASSSEERGVWMERLRQE